MMKLLLTLLAFMATMAMNAGDFVSGGIVYNSTITDNDDGSRTFKLVLKDGSAAEGEVVIPEKLLVDGINELTLTEIGASAFENNTKITRVVIPDCVFEMGKSAFAGCTNLTSIDLPAKLETIPLKAFSGCIKLESVTVKSSFTGGIAARGVGDEAFKDCKSLKSIDLSKGAEEIGINAFYGCSSLESVILPTAGLDKLDNFCFKNCTALLSIHIPSSVTSIGEDIFAGCTGMVEAIVEKGSKTYAGKNLFLNCTGLKTATVGWEGTLPGSIFKGCSSLENVTLIVTNEISANAFEGCSSLTSIVWPHSIKAFGEEAFKGCSSLKEIDIPEGVKELPWGLFEDCIQLEHVSLPESLTTINEKAFCRCQSLESLKLPSRLTTIKASAFAMCNNLTSLTFPSTLTSLGTSSFYHCSALQFLDFRACTGLKIKDTRRDDKEELVFRTVPEETVILLPGDELPAGMGEGYAVFDEKTGTLTFKYEIAAPEGLNVFKNINDASWCWNIDMSQLKKVVFESSFANARPKSTFQWFYCATSLTEITGLQYLNTSEVTSMEGMFSNCGSLTSLDLSSFDTSSVTNMGWMFNNCTSLKTIYVGDKWSTQNVTSCENMFEGCEWLIGGLGTTFDENHIDDAYARIDGGNISPGYFTSSSERDLGYQALGYAIFDESTGTLTFKYGEKPSGKYVFDTDNTNYGLFSSSGPGEMTPWAKFPITKVVFDPSYAKAHPKSTSWWFSYSSGDGEEWGNSITEFVGLEYLNTSYVKDMSFMFGCPNITSLDVSHFNTSNVINMHGMFSGCTNLTSLDVSNFDTGKVRKMTAMFSGCEKLESLDVSHFNTSNVYDMWGLFRSCMSLKSIDVSHFDTRNVTEMGGLFHTCTSLTSLDVSNFDTSNVTSMNMMFWGCSGLKTIDLSRLDTRKVTKMSEMFMLCTGMTHLDLSNFDTSNVDNDEGFEYMFYGCMNLTSLNLSSFNTSKVQSLYCTFMGCESLKEIDLSNFDTEKVRAMAFMFYSCKNLQTIYVGEKWNTGNLTNPEDNLMFVDCNQLVGSKGTCYDANHTDTEYAHVDGENGAPGYFTLAYMDDGVSYLPSDDGSLQVRNATCKEVVDIPSSLYVEGQSMLVKGIRNEAFMDNSDLVIVSIPESIESIGTSAFAGCSGLKIIYCYATDPVALGSANARVFTSAGEEIALSVFEGVDKNSCVLYVPKGCTGKYKTASGWKEFAHIEEMPSNVKGDVNDDGVLDDKDLKAVVDHIIGKTPEGSFDVNIADINKDEKVNAADLVFFVKLMGQKR